MHDVVIIGAGLAGSAAAIGLARQGARVLLLDAGRYPRHKMCGEFLSPESLPVFRRLGIWDEIASVPPVPVTSMRLTAPDGAVLDGALPHGATGLSRYRLDALLIEAARQAGAEVREGCAASGVSGDLTHGFEINCAEEALAARVVIGAWGKRSALDRVLHRPFFRQDARFLAIKRHVRGIPQNQVVELHGFEGGYCGVSAVEGGAVNLCLLATWRAWERSGRNVPAFWTMIQEENSYLATRLRGAESASEDIVISNISFAPRAAVEAEILMAGDSAALISPLAGNGQAMALQAGEAASELVGAYLSGALSVKDLTEGYARQWRGLFAERVRLGRWLQPLFLNPRALSAGLRVGRRFPALVRWAVTGTRDRSVAS